MNERTGGDPLRVLSVSPSVTGGGAERVALTLHERYLAAGLDSWLAVANVNAEAPNLVPIPVDAGRSAWARTVLRASRGIDAGGRQAHPIRWSAARLLRAIAEPARTRSIARGLEDMAFPGTAALPDLLDPQPDVLHLHNLHGSYFDVRALPALSRRQPTVITMHDAWLLTGHCAHPMECERWKQGCGECPDLDRYVPVWGDETAANRAIKRQALLDSRVALATPSRWLLSMVEESGLVQRDVSARVIPNGVDTDIFRPGDRSAARRQLGLAEDRQVIIMSARGARENPYKGYATLRDAVLRLPARVAENMTLLLLGEEGPIEPLGAATVHPAGFVTDSRLVAEYYRAADVAVHPSTAEVFGMAVVEAMACGTSVVASRTGGIPEIIEDEVSGMLVAPQDGAELAGALERLLGDAELRSRLADRGAAEALRRFSITAQVDAYLGWYDELLEQRRAERGTT